MASRRRFQILPVSEVKLWRHYVKPFTPFYCYRLLVFCIVHHYGFPGTHGKVKQLTGCHLLNLAFSFSQQPPHTLTHILLPFLFRPFSFKGPPIGRLSGSAALSKQLQTAFFTCCYSEPQTLDHILSHMRVS